MRCSVSSAVLQNAHRSAWLLSLQVTFSTLRIHCHMPHLRWPHHGQQCPRLRDDMTDMWAMGVLMHTAISCANPTWHMAFDPEDVDEQNLCTSERDAAQQHRILQHQEEWVKSLILLCHVHCCSVALSTPIPSNSTCCQKSLSSLPHLFKPVKLPEAVLCQLTACAMCHRCAS